jgi:hypothetical protein
MVVVWHRLWPGAGHPGEILLLLLELVDYVAVVTLAGPFSKYGSFVTLWNFFVL